MTERTWSTPEVAWLTGATWKQIDYWRRAGYVEPKFDGGSGVRIRWTWNDLLKVATLRLVSQPNEYSARAPAQRTSRLLREADLEAEFLLIEPRVETTTIETVLDLLRAGECVTVLPLGAMRARLLRQIAVA